MKINYAFTTLSPSAIFMLLSFIPLLQLIFPTYNGGLLFIVDNFIFNDHSNTTEITNWIVNFPLSILFLIFYYNSKTKKTELTFSILFLIFSFCFIFFQISEILSYEVKPYFLLSLIESFLSAIILNITWLVKYKNQQAANTR